MLRNRVLKIGTALGSALVAAPAFAVTDFDGLTTAAATQVTNAITVGMGIAVTAIAFLVGYKLVKRVVKGF